MGGITPTIPKAFVEDANARWVLSDIINDFYHEEKQAIYYSYAWDGAAENIGEKIELSQTHVASALWLYRERLTSKLDFFKRIIPHDENDHVPVSEILFPETEA
ncbi:MAG: hypothetical protein FWG38_00855 [Defluviitaleaceae bacterium]|nr:hypothetical protein [Defluviitaleaceae bacterium]